MAGRVQWSPPRDADGREIVDAYLRMSDGFDGKEENREDQLADIMPLFERNNWALGEVLVDEVSAWKRNVKRPYWEQLLVRIESGLSAGVVFWHQDRLMRQPYDLERLFLLVESGRDGLIMASAHGKHDLMDPTQRFLMRNIVAHACLSSDDTSRRAKRKNRGRRERGLLSGGGPRAFGWDDGKVEREKLKAEQDALKWGYEWLYNGGTVQAVADEWNRRGTLSFYGKPWDISTVRRTMSRGRYVGRIEHEGRVVGTMVDFEPVVPVEHFDHAQSVFASRKRGRPVSAKSLGAGIIECGQCDHPLSARPRYKQGVAIPTYHCYKTSGGCGRCVIDQAPVDAILRTRTINHLSQPETAERTSKFLAEARDERARILEQLAGIETQMTDLVEKLAAGEMLQAVWDAHNRTAMARHAKLSAELDAVEAEMADAPRVKQASVAELSTAWDEAWASGDKQPCRDMLRAATATVRIQILPGGRGGSVPTAERISYVHR